MVCNTDAGDEGGTQGESAREGRDADSRRKGMKVPEARVPESSGKGCRFQRKSDANSREEGSRFEREAMQVLDGKRCRFQSGRKQIPK
jgi:hypothetical protein